METGLEEIRGSLGLELQGYTVLHCITGSIAAYKAPEISRELIRHGADVYAAISHDGLRFVSEDSMEWATGRPPIVELTSQTEHIQLTQGGIANFILVAPCTANTAAKIANGIADTPITAIALAALGRDLPVLVVPAMHESMYQSVTFQENLEKLSKIGVRVQQPKLVEGKAKIPTVEEVTEEVIVSLYKKDLEGRRILVTAGPTREPLDPVRVLTNRSSGRMGVAMATEARRRGGYVSLVHGPLWTDLPIGVDSHPCETAEEMLSRVKEQIEEHRPDVFVSAAAVSDYSPKEPKDEKVRSREHESWTVELESVRKILEEARRLRPEMFNVAFKVEVDASEEDLEEKGGEFLDEGSADAVVLNDASAIGSEVNRVLLVTADGEKEWIGPALKSDVARRLWEELTDKVT